MCVCLSTHSLSCLTVHRDAHPLVNGTLSLVVLRATHNSYDTFPSFLSPLLYLQVREHLVGAKEIQVTKLALNSSVSGRMERQGDWAYFELKVTSVHVSLWC